MVNERIPEIMKQLGLLCNKMRDKRLEILKDNEEHLAESANAKDDDDDEEDDNEEVADDGNEEEKDEYDNLFGKAKRRDESD